MQIFGIGTDIIEIARFQRNGEPLGQKFMDRCFHKNEQERLQDRPLENVAGYFAAKEAVAKALGTGFVGFRPAAIEICHNKAGKPYVILHDNAAKIAEDCGVTDITVSISHCKTVATAMAVAVAGET
ncbi:MAG: holo-ACP synthase [Defluviitaleaceae bacterium]|nr:holo-ACP synthase [Defluviitaleaceae bacterium]